MMPLEAQKLMTSTLRPTKREKKTSQEKFYKQGRSSNMKYVCTQMTDPFSANSE